jgi:beta-xylosidase
MTSTDTTSRTIGRWNDTSLSPRARAEALLVEMTPRERLQQLGSSWPGSEDLDEAVAPLQETHHQAVSFEDAIVDGLGQLTRPFGTAPLSAVDGMHRLAGLQRAVMAANRFGIPAVAHEECLTGFTAWSATVYPTSLASAATFNPLLVREMAARIGADLAAVGVHQGLSPVLDVVRDYRWGRVEETFGEDPYLVSELASAYVEGLQSEGVIATLKHFVGYSASRGGRNHAPVSVGPRELSDVLLIPFEKAVTKAGVRSVMNSYTEIDGVPSVSDHELLTTLLRDQWGFEGTVVSDYWAIAFLASMHRLVETSAVAGAQALTAGLDVELPHTLAYTDDAVRELDTSIVDRAVLRVLTQKAELGLLDPDWQPLEPAHISLDSDNNKAVARTLAEESIVLLHNPTGALPLRSPARIGVIGPAANDSGCLFGCYSFPNHVLPNFPEAGLGITAPTVLDGIRAEFSEATVRYALGVPILDSDDSQLNDAIDLALDSDVVVLVVGDRSGMFGHGTSGEGCDVLDLDLPGIQSDLVSAVLNTGVPVVLVTVSGRPYAIGSHVARSAAAIQSFFPGQEGAAAIAGVLSGRMSPSGRLPVQLPGSASAQPGTYLAPPLALRSDGVSNIDPTPAFPFGFGLGYTTFRIDDCRASTTDVESDGEVIVVATVTNTGDRAGTAVPQLYLSDPVAEVTRPVRQLIGFSRVALEPGESSQISFAVSADMFSYTGRDLRRRVDPGTVILTVAQDAAEAGSAVTVEVTGETRFVDHTRVTTTASAALAG